MNDRRPLMFGTMRNVLPFSKVISPPVAERLLRTSQLQSPCVIRMVRRLAETVTVAELMSEISGPE